ncbi:thermonuclease family protein [Thiohalobacter sp.]|uniref:thermonuclease family protein n=1 Tax=Thiohalobacter sp. TaxID=2025948 RepID=UPI002614EEA3|nr:thermonuclease family protein [Thiohalobacter sp.]
MRASALPSLERAFRIAGALFCLWLAGAALAAPDCAADRIDDRVRVRHVTDGDTLILGDGRHLRLIGVNTPEMGRDGEPDEPGAIAARDHLRRLVFVNGNQVALRYDRERQDRYGRVLAHLFLRDGRNVAALLIAAGAGFPITIPPNDWQADCYRRLGEAARAAGLGVWSEPRLGPLDTERLSPRERGFRRVRGRVSHVSESRGAVWINFGRGFALRIRRDHLPRFADLDLQALAGRRVEAMGWLYYRRGQLRMSLVHPSALRVLDTEANVTEEETP